MQNQRVCHMTCAHPRHDLRIFQKECVSLANLGYECFCVVSDEDGEDFENGVRTISTRFKAKNRFQRFFKAAKLVFKTAKAINAEVYHFHDPELLPYGLKLKKLGKKVIFDSHEDVVTTIEEKDWIPSLLRKLVKFLFSRYQEKVVMKLDAVVVVTPHMVDFFKAINPRTYLITNYPILKEISFVPFDERTKQICFAGGISEQWSHEIISSAVAEIQNVKYVLAGKASEEYIEKLRTLAMGKLDYLGKLKQEKVYELYVNSFAGMAINRSKQTIKSDGSLGNTKIFEYMMCSLPVICTDFAINQEIIANNNCGICVPFDDLESIKLAIEKLSKNPALCSEMGKNGRKLVEEVFNWHSAEKELIHLYNTVINQESN